MGSLKSILHTKVEILHLKSCFLRSKETKLNAASHGVRSVLVTILEPAHNALCLPPNFFYCMRMLLGMEDLKTTVYAKFDWGGGGEGVGLRECTMRHSKLENE